jgi:hypothetical protein
MTAEKQAIWECFLMRRDRDLEWLWQREQAGDPLGRKFFTGFGEWLEKCRKMPADKAPQCLAHLRANLLQPCAAAAHVPGHPQRRPTDQRY